MKTQKMPTILAGFGMVLLILDTKTALTGMAEGIDICLQMLIPSLFPFLFLSAFMTPSSIGIAVPLIGRIGKLTGIPEGAESMFLTGLLSGYPVGAKLISQAVEDGSISRENGKQMLAFCSNAGPAFIFGIGSRLFPEMLMCWALWGIHILSAFLTGMIFKAEACNKAKLISQKSLTPATALKNAIGTMAMVCGWVVLFRVLLCICQRWFLWLLPVWTQYFLAGVLELANGCCALGQINPIQLRFILCSGLLGFGGLCVLMQTYSVCKNLDSSLYLPGKIMQAILSMLLAAAVISRENRLPAMLFLSICICSLFFFRRKAQIMIAFCSRRMYNEANRSGR